MAAETTSSVVSDETKKKDQLDSLQTPFNVRLYGRLIEGISIKCTSLNGRMKEQATLRLIQSRLASLKTGQSELAEFASTYDPEQDSAFVANIYGFTRGSARTLLPTPVAFVVDDRGRDSKGWDGEFSADDGFKCWEFDPRAITFRFDIRLGTFDELLQRAQPTDEAAPGVTEPEGGTLIRGADNRLYMIPLALEPFEVRDAREISELQIEAQQFGREVKVDSVRSLTGRSTLVARSTLQVRSTLTLRSTLASARR
jgi:hypothetical protein